MTAATGIIDTNLVILLGHLDPKDVPVDPQISAVTVAELSVGVLVAEDEHARAERTHHLQLAEADFDALPFDIAAARSYGSVAASLRAIGRKAGARRFDAMIAATAMAHGLPLYTCNPEDFRGIDGLDLRAVPHPGR